MVNNNQIKINLDKICAEYGMGLLNIPQKLYRETNLIIENATTLEDFKNKNYNQNNWDDNLKEFFSFDLINPLKELQNKAKKEENFNKLKEKQMKLDFKNFETEITKALGIIVEDGPFAYIIWIKSQDREPHRAMLIQTARILQILNLINQIKPDKNLKDHIENAFLNEISSDLKKTLFVKAVLEKMLIYSRYKAKAMQHE